MVVCVALEMTSAVCWRPPVVLKPLMTLFHTPTNTAWAYQEPLLDYFAITLAQVVEMEQRKAASLTILWTVLMNKSASTSLDVMRPISH